jgi:polysaccharide biosynthesis/export protein
MRRLGGRRLPVLRVWCCACLLAFGLAACGGGPSGDEVIAQARDGEQVAFDVVKIDDAVLTTVLAQQPPGFDKRFKSDAPPPELKLAVGDTVAVVIWESAANGLFGNSLTELTLPAGAAARMSTEPATTLRGLPPLPLGLTTTPELMAFLFGGAAARDLAALGGLSPDLAGDGLSRGASASLLGRDGGASASGAAGEFGGGGAARGLTSRAAGGLSLDAASGLSPGGGLGAAAGLSADAGARQALAAMLGRREGAGGERLQHRIDLATQTGRPGTRVPNQPVGPDGAISVPYAGRIVVAGRTPSEVERKIEQLLGPKALDPQVLVAVRRSVANSVSVAGEAIRGRRVPLSGGGERLLQVIAAAGGARAPVHDTFVRLSRGGVTATLPLAKLVSDPAQDIFAAPGDVLTLVRRPQTFTVFGAVGRNAVGANSAITFTSDRLSLAEALAKAGGLLDERADARAVFLFRYEPESVVRALGQPIASGAHDGHSPVVYRLDLKEAKSYLLAKQFPVRDKDMIFVANAKVVPLYYFFQALGQLTGPVTSTLAVCSSTKC